MSTELLISKSPGEIRTALVQDGVLVEYDSEQEAHRSVVGNVYRGRVTRVLPGMQAAFVDIGLDRAAFLYVDDVLIPEEAGTGDEADAPDPEADGETEPEGDPSEEGEGADAHPQSDLHPEEGSSAESTQPSAASRRNRPPVQELLHPGQDLLVQVRKAPFANKGARVTAYVTLPGRFVVFMPTVPRLGVSRKITKEAERKRLKDILTAHTEPNPGGGFIARTRSEGQPESALARDVEFLRSLWSEVEDKGKTGPVPGLVLADLDLVLRACRDLFDERVDRLLCDDPDQVERLRRRVLKHAPDLARRIHLYAEDTSLFEAAGIEGQISRLFERKVHLPSGGSLVIDEAEALTAIDVNTGRYVGRKDLEQTILRTNLEAAEAAAAQIRLRDLGGIIVVDFIDMQLPTSRQQVYDAFVTAMAQDRGKTQLATMNEFGLLELTRRRTRGSVHRRHTEACPYCQGRGRLRSKRSIGLEILRRVQRLALASPGGQLWVSAMPDVAQHVADSPELAALEHRLGRKVWLEARPELHQEVFHVTLR